MDKKTLQNSILEKAYQPQQWIEVLHNYFGATTIHQSPANIPLPNNPWATNAVELGNFYTADERLIGIYQVHLTAKAWIDKNRVGLRNLLRQVYKYDVDAALVVFVQDTKWRFSFVSETRSAEGKKETAPKRFTYLFGEGEKCRTAADRFDKLLQKQGSSNSCQLDLKDFLEAFNVEKLSKDFYTELYNWYNWTLSDALDITFPKNTHLPQDDREKLEEQIIRLITRLLFVWFIKQKNMVPASLFEPQFLKTVLAEFDENSYNNGNYYNAILQNLFFATLNKAIPERAFAKNENSRDIKSLYRYAEMFCISENEVLELFNKIPFLNGGLFECLDKEISTEGIKYHLDGFSRNDKKLGNHYSHRAFIPNCVFFDPQKGIIPLLERYNFTIEENSSDELQVALDPELLGRVFENLLATYNPETQTSARKQTGSFYTPREIVNYMVKESLHNYLLTHLPHIDLQKELNNQEKQAIYKTLLAVKILDPACGSGAFPMGALLGIIEYLQQIGVGEELDLYQLKLHLIEKCIYGVDIQTIAVQICKLRFFISLTVEQKALDYTRENYGVLTLPNLETNFVAANTLIPLQTNAPATLFTDPAIQSTKDEILAIRHQHFSANTTAKKIELRKQDETLRQKLIELLEKNGEIIDNKVAAQVALWNPYDQNSSSPFYDSEWMFGIKAGFDMVIGNPPYVSTKGISDDTKKDLLKAFGFADDLYFHFIVKGFQLLKTNGVNCMITPDTYFTTFTKKQLRKTLIDNQLLILLHLGHNVFEAAMVSTAVFIAKKNTATKNEIVQIIDAKQTNTINNAVTYSLPQAQLGNTINGAFFVPNATNLAIHKKLGAVHKNLIDTYWDRIATSRDIEKNKIALDTYRANLKEGEFTLVGLVTEGGQGLATANNGKYVGVKAGTKEAIRIAQTRIKKLADANNELGTNYTMPSTEAAIWQLFETIKETHGRDIFGQGYLYKIIPEELIADVSKLTQAEKEEGIKTKASFVPYDKGDKDGNRWYLPTPYYINWNTENVAFLKNNSGKKGEGMPVVRNPQFYFREGFCWIDVNSTYLKCRIKEQSVNDVISMALYSLTDKIPVYYVVTLINSSFISELVQSFLNATSHFQINDCRALPIPVPTIAQLSFCKNLFVKAVATQQDFFASQITEIDRAKILSGVQVEVDAFVKNLYAINHS